MEQSFNPWPAVAAAKMVLMALLLAAVLFLARGIESTSAMLLALALVTVAYALAAFLLAKFHTITLQEQTLAYQSGLLATRRIIIPYAKITEAGYTQGIMQRIFGVGNLSVDTAGGSPVAIRLNDVRYSDLKKILNEINRKTGKEGGL